MAQNTVIRGLAASAKKFTVTGLVPPVFTPLKEDLSINYSVIPEYAKYLASNGIKSVLGHGGNRAYLHRFKLADSPACTYDCISHQTVEHLIIECPRIAKERYNLGGSTGEHMTRSVEERKKVIDEWVKAAQTTRQHIMVQVGGAPLVDVLHLTEYCQNNGVDSILTLPELYFKPTTVDELVSYVELVAKAAADLPVLYYHIPRNTKVEVNMPAFVAEASKRIPNFMGLKYTTVDLSEAAQVLRNLREDQEFFLGGDTLLAPAALLGVKSGIGTSYNLFPHLAQDILNAIKNNDVVKARECQARLTLALEAHTCEGAWVPVMKAGMEIVSGLNLGPPSLPQKPISAESKQRIRERLVKMGLAE